MEDIIYEEGLKVKEKKQTWKGVSELLKEKFNIDKTPNACEVKFRKIVKKKSQISVGKEIIINCEEKESIYGDGSIDAEKIVNLTPEEKRNQATILMKMGFDPKNWEMKQINLSSYQQHTKTQETKNLYAVKVRVSPKVFEPTHEDYQQAIREFFKEQYVPRPQPVFQEPVSRRKNLLMFLAPIELHYGKLAFAEISDEYNQAIAEERFFKIHDRVIEEQQFVKASKLYYPIGNDWFNSDTTENTTSRGTQMQNCTHWKLMFKDAIRMHYQAIDMLIPNFDEIEIELLQGNHDTMASFYLVEVIRARYHDMPNIKVKDTMKETIAHSFGETLIVMNHGYSKGTQNIIDNIASVFREQWASASSVYFFQGDKHHMEIRKEKHGIIKEMLPSASGTDEYHENNGWNTALQQHLFFVFDEKEGKRTEFFVNFPKKKMSKILERVIK